MRLLWQLRRGPCCAWRLGFLAASSLSVPFSRLHSTQQQQQHQQRYGADVMQETDYAYHIKAPFAGPCVDVIAATTGMSHQATQHLLRIGAVYHKQLASPKAFRTVDNAIVQPGEYLRVHHKPRMFETSHIDWKASVVAETEDYLVCHKPAGIPIHPNVDNLYENVVTLLQNELGLEDLHTSHRLDTDTSGLVVLGKTAAFQAWFSNQMKLRKVTKTYKALLSPASVDGVQVEAAALPVGETLTSYLISSKAVPKQYMPTEQPSSKEAKLIVRKASSAVEKTAAEWRQFAVDCLQDSAHNRARSAIEDWTSDKPSDYPLKLMEADIELVTGRTHQIRGQLRLHGWHVAGDNMYEGASSKVEPDIYRSGPFLALQAHQIEFPKYLRFHEPGERPSLTTYSARTPWWHRLIVDIDVDAETMS